MRVVPTPRHVIPARLIALLKTSHFPLPLPLFLYTPPPWPAAARRRCWPPSLPRGWRRHSRCRPPAPTALWATPPSPAHGRSLPPCPSRSIDVRNLHGSLACATHARARAAQNRQHGQATVSRTCCRARARARAGGRWRHVVRLMATMLVIPCISASHSVAPPAPACWYHLRVIRLFRYSVPHHHRHYPTRARHAQRAPGVCVCARVPSLPAPTEPLEVIKPFGMQHPAM